ncbi:hypothetical protein [Haladaptatus sp. NG-WS-4]
MLAVARAFVQSPDVLLLDKPSEGLAPVIVDDLRETFADVLAEDVTVLLTEQNVDFAFDVADRSYVIDNGQVVFEGSVEELRSRGPPRDVPVRFEHRTARIPITEHDP